MIVVGLADGRNADDSNGSLAKQWKVKDELEQKPRDAFFQSLEQGRERLMSEAPRALVHHVLIFDYDDPNYKSAENFTVVPSPAKSKTTTIKTVMCDLISQLLAEMTTFAKSLQAIANLESPKVPRQNIQRPLAEYSGSLRPNSADPNQRSNSPAVDLQKSEHRMSMPAHILSNIGSRSSSPASQAASPPSEARAPARTFEEIANSSSQSPKPIESQRPLSRDRASMQGFGPNSLAERERNKGEGRIRVVIGSLHLLAGRWPDAVKELEAGANIAKSISDHLWHGKALDYLLVACLMYAWTGLDFRVSFRIAVTKFEL